MSPNETSSLLKNYREQQYTSDCNHNITTGGYHAVDDNNHIVYVNKDATEYEPIFCLNDYYSSLTLDELLPYKLDPWWQKLRRILFLTFWLTLIMTFITACLLSYIEAGHATCNVIPKSGLDVTASGVLNSSPSVTTLPTTIAKVLSTDLLGSKLAAAAP